MGESSVFKLLPLPRNLAAALRDIASKKVEVRVSAARDLARWATTPERGAVVAELERALSTDSAASVRAAAAEALADAEARESQSVLMTALEDRTISVRQRALLALGELAEPGNPKACKAAEQAARDPAPELRFQAMVALGRLRGRDGTESLLKGTRDPDGHVRYIAWRVLEEQWCEEAHESGDTLPESVRMRAQAALRDEVREVRLAAAILLGRAGDRAGAEVIVEAVRSGGARDPEDELAAIELSGELGLGDACGGLRRHAFGWLGAGLGATSFQARVALAKLGDERARAAIVRDLRSGSRDRRTVAVAAAGQARLGSARALIQAMLGDEERADQAAVAEALERIDGATQAVSIAAEP